MSTAVKPGGKHHIDVFREAIVRQLSTAANRKIYFSSTNPPSRAESSLDINLESTSFCKVLHKYQTMACSIDAMGT